jgi:hypothetical protein
MFFLDGVDISDVWVGFNFSGAEFVDVLDSSGVWEVSEDNTVEIFILGTVEVDYGDPGVKFDGKFAEIFSEEILAFDGKGDKS